MGRLLKVAWDESQSTTYEDIRARPSLKSSFNLFNNRCQKDVVPGLSFGEGLGMYLANFQPYNQNWQQNSVLQCGQD